MSRDVHVWSRGQILVLGRDMVAGPARDATLISISQPLDRLPREKFAWPWRRILHLEFHDATAEQGDIRHQLFTFEQAHETLEFAAQNLHCEWHVHCDAGMSRSVAVGRFFAEFYGRSLKLHACPTDTFANPHVLRMLRQAAGGGQYR